MSDAMVTLPVADNFPNVVGGGWRLSDDDTPLDLRGVLQHTIRRCPVKTGEDAERTYEILQAVRASENGAIEMRKSDFDWMISHFQETAHRVWLAPDAAYLIHYLRDNSKSSQG